MSALEYIVVHQRAWMNEHGHGIDYHSNLTRWATRREAIKRGFVEAESDDFNVAILRAGRLVAFAWMDKDFAPEDYDLDEIGQQLGLEVSHA